MSVTKKEKFIRNIKADFEKEKNTKSYERVKRMAKTISENLYSEDSHFIYELIQNAQDNSYAQDITKRLDFYVSRNGILIKNNEKGFEESHIESICDFNDSTKSKKKALGYIGEKGIGFKSVFAITDNPAIHSNGYKFYFKKDEYIEPYWIDSLEEYPVEFKDNSSTGIYLPYSENFENKDDLEKKINDIEPILLLFLDNLDEINIYNKDKQILSVSKTFTIDNGQDITVIESKKSKDQFVVYSKEINCRKDIKEEKREGVKKRKLILAFPVEEIEDTRLFSFLPTEINTGLPFLIQSDFLLTASRGDILKNKEWNKWLLEEIVDFFVETFLNLQSIDNLNYLRYLDKEESSNLFLDKYYQSMLDKLQYEKLFLSIKDENVTSSQICILKDFDFMIDFLEDIQYSNSDGEKYFYLKKDFYIPDHLIDLWNINIMYNYDFLKTIGDLSEVFTMKFEKDNTFFENLINYIDTENLDYENLLMELPIIPLDDGDNIIFKTKKELEDIQLFFKLDNEGTLNSIFQDLKVISSKYQEKLQNIQFYKDIFEVKQPNVIEILKSLENNNEFFLNSENNVNLLVYIKNNLGENQRQIIELLAKNYKFINKRNYLCKHIYKEANSWSEDTTPIFSTKLYISSKYLNSKNCIEKIVNKYCTEQGLKKIDFISDKYLEYDKSLSNRELKSLQEEWRDLFYELKINDDMKLESENLEMWANDSQYNRRIDIAEIQNIPFISSPKFVDPWDTNYKIINLDIQKLSKYDSVFLFKKLLKLSTISSGYHRVNSYYRGFQHKYVTIPWIDTIEDNYPIFIGEEKYKIKDFYLEVNEALQKFFQSLPKEYLTKENSNIDKIFNIKEKPSLDDIVELVENKKIKNFKDIKSIFSYIHFHHPKLELELNEIPISVKDKIKYITLDKLIWKDGVELNLIEIESSYGSDFKRFFVEQIGIQETPTIEQYIEYLKKNPKNYIKILHKFILQIDEFLDVKYKYPMESEKIFSINKKLFSIDEIIFNDEGIKTTVIPNLFNINQKIVPIFEKIVNEYDVKRISTYSREIQTFNAETNEEIQAVYIKLLNFTWDYIFSKNQKNFEELKNDKEFILETKNVIFGASAEIVLKIDVNGKYIDIEQDIAILNDTIYLSKSIDERKVGTEISKYIVKKVGIDFEKIERFYDKVYRIKDYSKDEYYEEEHIEEPKDDDCFDAVFEKLINAPIDEKNDDLEEEEDTFTDTDESVNENEEDDQDETSDGIINKEESSSTHTQTKKVNNNNKPINTHVKNDKTICPECNIPVNKKNLKKHLCKVHNLHCGQLGESSENNQNLNSVSKTSPIQQIKDHNKAVDQKPSNIDPGIILNTKEYEKQLKAQQRRIEHEYEQMRDTIFKSKKISNKTKNKQRDFLVYTMGEKSTKDFFKEKSQYNGNCQICGFTFSTNNGFYCERFTWTDFRKISWTKSQSNTMTYKLVEPGNSLCLCARCHSIIKGGGEFKADFLNNIENNIEQIEFDDFIEKINSVKLASTPECFKEHIEFDDMYALEIKLNDNNEKIYFTEEHLLQFFIFLKSK